MSVFMEKGYEAATMRDIAAAMHVVPGLCYRYFESKQMLYDTAIEQSVKDITHPMIERLKENDDSLDGFLDKMEQLFIQTDGKEKYHHFFHKTLLYIRLSSFSSPIHTFQHLLRIYAILLLS